jgi:hypothetical protein
LSSRKLLNLIRRLPDGSEFKTRAGPPFGRDGDWTELEEMTAQLHNTVAKFVAAKFEDSEYTVFSSPRERVASAVEAEELEEFHDSEFGKLMARFD